MPRLRVAAIGAPSLASMTQKVAQSADVGLHRVLRLAVTDPLPRLVEALNAFRPDLLNAYPSIAALLADEQLAVACASRRDREHEQRAPHPRDDRSGRARVRRAPFDLYGSTEGLWGVDCEHRRHPPFRGLVHRGERRPAGRPVPDGEPGARLLVTNLFNRTLPMIRFEVLTLSRSTARRVPAGGRSRACTRSRGAAPTCCVSMTPPAGASRSTRLQLPPVSADPSVREFQIVQCGQRIVLRVAVSRQGAGEEATARLVTAVEERLRAAGVAEPDVAAEVDAGARAHASRKAEARRDRRGAHGVPG